MKTGNNFKIGMICLSIILLAACGKPEIAQPPVPADTIAYCRITDLESSWNSFASSEFVTRFSKLKLWSDPAFQASFTELKKSLADIEKATKVPINKETFMALFGKRVDVAVFQGIRYPGMAFIIDLKEKTPALKIIDYLQKQARKDKIKTIKYKDKELSMIPSENGLSPCYFFTDSHLVFTSTENAAHKCIDVLRGDAPIFMKSAEFESMRKTVGDHDTILYIDFEKFLDIIQNLVGDSELSAMNDTDIKYILGLDMNRKGIEGQFRAFTKDEEIVDVLAKPKTLDRAMNWIPEDTLIAGASAVNLSKMLDYKLKQLDKMKNTEAAKIWLKLFQTIEDNYSVDLKRDVQPWLGEGMFFCIPSIDNQGAIPLPQLVFGVHTTDDEKAAALFHKIEGELTSAFADKHLQFQSEQLGNIEYRFVPVGFGPNISPGYAIADEFVLVGLSKPSIRRVVSAYSGEMNSIENDKRFRELRKSKDKHQVAFQYVNSEKLCKAMSDLVNNYRLFFPETINPDDVRELLDTFSLIQGYYSEIARNDDGLYGRIGISIR